MADAWDDLRTATCSDGAPSARNLLVTVFGDAIAPRSIDLAVSVRSLAVLLASFGVNERLVRTSLSRLVNDGILAVTSIGRRSYYGVAPGARRLFADADHKIYTNQPSSWDGRFTVVMIDAFDSTPEARADLRGQIVERGFGTAAPNVLMSALAQPSDIADLIADEIGRVAVMRSTLDELPGTVNAVGLAHHLYRLHELHADYDELLDRFAGYTPDMAAALGDADAFKLRTLLVASYRRVVLDDPALPDELLTRNWVGHEAARFIGDLYGACFEASERFVESGLEAAGEVLPTSAGPDRFAARATA